MLDPDPMAEIIRASACRRTRWKNGGGETMEIAIAPAGASLDDFDWRISMAIVASDGPFSVFAGVARTICILDGAGIRLAIDAEPARELNTTSAPLPFSGDAAAHSTLIDGVVTDFNVMTRRDRFRHVVERIRIEASGVHDVAAEVRGVFCQSGVVSIEASHGRERLGPRDTMLRSPSDDGPWRVHAEDAATVCLVTISALHSQPLHQEH